MRSSKAAVDSDLFVIGQFVHGSGSLGHFAAVKMLKSIRHLSERGLLMASQDTVLSVLADFN
jgi:isopentenyl phosphate kinase